MSTITKEWLLTTIAELEEERDAVPGAVNEDAANALAAMKLALASLEAEAVAYVDPFAFHNFIVYRAGETYNKRMGREWMWANPDAGLIPVYTAPPATPAPVSVPDENGLLPCPCCGGRAEFDYDDDNLNWISCNVCGISTDTAYHTDVDARDRLRNVWNLRTAMLQGSDGNSQVIPDGWKLVPIDLTGAMTNAMTDAILDDLHNVDVWRSVLAAAPQQEAKNV
ncbi:Lar family restriction alleviation protein [Enterobacter hormaechei]|uniref:Lar family restriction alleviation protein n=1 Tax=Enterobacter hormaechei TaxID=158836 RepID=UPI0022F040FF|nr:Lar family restriction alleviation protein [Enterobacter hormaechei]MDA4777447.1 Lar family restriction alleviation protein [Enterobacter hormaechei]